MGRGGDASFPDRCLIRAREFERRPSLAGVAGCAERTYGVGGGALEPVEKQICKARLVRIRSKVAHFLVIGVGWRLSLIHI